MERRQFNGCLSVFTEPDTELDDDLAGNENDLFACT